MGNIVILTGAGISAESGIATFRDSNGLWENHSIEDVATPQGFARNPELVHRFYNERRAQLKTVEPNAAHLALAELQQKFNGEVHIITQNVDDLHERAGAKVIHMHGELRKVRCQHCGEVKQWNEDLTIYTKCEKGCASTKELGSLRPHVVWFGEGILRSKEIYKILESFTVGDVFACIGTSNMVFPANGFYLAAKEVGATTVGFDMRAAPIANCDTIICGAAGETVPAWVKSVLGESCND